MNRSMLSPLNVLTHLLIITTIFIFYPASPRAGYAQTTPASIIVLDRNQTPVTRITDGDQIQLQINLGEKTDTSVTAEFHLEASGEAFAACEIPAGNNQCETAPFPALGWHWQGNGQAGIRARSGPAAQASPPG